VTRSFKIELYNEAQECWLKYFSCRIKNTTCFKIHFKIKYNWIRLGGRSLYETSRSPLYRPVFITPVWNPVLLTWKSQRTPTRTDRTLPVMFKMSGNRVIASSVDTSMVLASSKTALDLRSSVMKNRIASGSIGGVIYGRNIQKFTGLRILTWLIFVPCLL